MQRFTGCLLAFSVGLSLLPGCSSPEIDEELSRLIAEHGLTGSPIPAVEVPDISAAKPQLGMKLFFAKSLGGRLDSACVSCHHPALGGGDGLALPIGVGAHRSDLLGPGREHPDGDFTVPRNAPTTFNSALWRRRMFWDGRVERLDELAIRTPDSGFGVADVQAGKTLAAAQARFPVTSADEMRSDFLPGRSNEHVRKALADRLRTSGSWRIEFNAVYGDSMVNYARIADAIAAYEHSQFFINSPWKAYVEGDRSALSPSAKRGALLFLRSRSDGGAGCASCHRGDTFSDENFWSICAPQIGRGKGDGESGSDDFGRARESKESDYRYAFRTPSLLNVEVTAPYTHAGAHETLEEVINHHAHPSAALQIYDPDQAKPAFVDDFELNRTAMVAYVLEHEAHVIETLRHPYALSSQQLADLVAFLKTLTDPCVVTPGCIDQWIPAADAPDADGTRVDAVNEQGQPL